MSAALDARVRVPPPRPWAGLYPPGVDAEIDPGERQSVAELFADSAVRYSDRIAVTCLGTDLTYGQLDRWTSALAAWFQTLGLPIGARVALMMPSLPQYLACQLALMRVGLVAVNVNPLYTPRELTHQLRDSGALAIVVLEPFAATVQATLAQVPLRHVVVSAVGDLLGRAKGTLVNAVTRHVRKAVPPWRIPGHTRLSDALSLGRLLPLREVRPRTKDLAMLQYTGGTTGVAKGAMLLHGNLLAASLQATAFMHPLLQSPPAVAHPVILVPLPLYHVFTIYMTMMGLSIGARIVLVPNPRDIDGLIGTMRKTPFHLMMGLNTLYRALADHRDIGRIDFRTCRSFVAGGTATQRSVAQRWQELSGRWITEGWGMTETSGGGTCNPPHLDQFNGSIGVPFPSTDVVIRDDNGRDLPAGSPGEICIAGPQVMAGYWQQPKATEEVFWPDGYLRTGDIGEIDSQGFVRIVDRKKDMALVSGFNVYPSEIEDVATMHPGVHEAAAVAVPDASTGEAVRLFVVRRDPALEAAALRAHCAANLTNYKRPREIVFVEALPKSPVGKILRRELRDR